MTNTIMVEANYDFATKVWFVASCDLFGVHAEASTFEQLCSKLPNVVRATIEADSNSDGLAGERLEIVVHASIRIMA
jgi:predicted RNase H-like HicB family nuclease